MWASWPRQQIAAKSNRKEEPLSESKTKKVANAPNIARLPTAAELLDEQERREALRAMEELFLSANNARKHLETMITQIASLVSKDDQPKSRALRFFIQESVFHLYRQSCKAAAQKAEEAVQKHWLEQLCRNVGELVTEYWKGQRYLGILINHTGVDLSAAADYQVWRESEKEYVARFRNAANRPLLKRTLPSTLPIVQTFEDRDPATMSV